MESLADERAAAQLGAHQRVTQSDPRKRPHLRRTGAPCGHPRRLRPLAEAELSVARRDQDSQTIRSEGGLLPLDLLLRVRDPQSQLPGTAPDDYGLPAGERLNEVITQSWNTLRKHWVEFRDGAAHLAAGAAGTGLTNDKWSLPLLRELGFGLLPVTAGPELAGRPYPIGPFLRSRADSPRRLRSLPRSPRGRTAGRRLGQSSWPCSGVPQPQRRPPLGDRVERPAPARPARQPGALASVVSRVRPRSDVLGGGSIPISCCCGSSLMPRASRHARETVPRPAGWSNGRRRPSGSAPGPSGTCGAAWSGPSESSGPASPAIQGTSSCERRCAPGRSHQRPCTSSSCAWCTA